MDETERLRAELERERARREEVEHELERFAYVVSHDLNEPLRMVTSFTALLSRRYGDALDDDAKTFIEFARDGAARLQEMLAALLIYSRAGRIVPGGEPIDVRAVVREAASSRGVAVRFEGELPEWSGHAEYVERALAHVVDNAAKFRSPERPPEIVVSAVGEDGVRIADNGTGIAAGRREEVFEVFRRLHTRDDHPGTGIGLPIVRKVAERHGGRAWIEDGVDGGVAVVLTLPGRRGDGGDTPAGGSRPLREWRGGE